MIANRRVPSIKGEESTTGAEMTLEAFAGRILEDCGEKVETGAPVMLPLVVKTVVIPHLRRPYPRRGRDERRGV
jgi:hypothetical protein